MSHHVHLNPCTHAYGTTQLESTLDAHTSPRPIFPVRAQLFLELFVPPGRKTHAPRKARLLVVFCPIPCYSGACIVAHALVVTLQSSASLLCSRSASSRARRCCSWKTNAQTRHGKQHLSLVKPGRSTNNSPVSPRQGCSRSGGPLLVQSALPPDKQLLA